MFPSAVTTPVVTALWDRDGPEILNDGPWIAEPVVVLGKHHHAVESRVFGDDLRINSRSLPAIDRDRDR